MSIIPKLATSLNRRDEAPNQELAAEIVSAEDRAAVDELITNLDNKNKGIRYDCIKVLYEIGYRRPYLIADHLRKFISLLESKDNRLQWGAMTALGCVVKERPVEVSAVLGKIVDAADRGSVITRDHCVNILISLSGNEKYAGKTFPLLLEQMMSCPANQLAMYAEKALPVIRPGNKGRFIHVLSGRLDGIEKESQRKRIGKVIAKADKN
jgi:hypothetical protein